jgi:hypothetical protein
MRGSVDSNKGNNDGEIVTHSQKKERERKTGKEKEGLGEPFDRIRLHD